ncbi:MAG: hypothetical protein JXA30_19215 [Deltaproteobacteria bacterium]|nr:hypothetical protein [Deltaproteobacteria bacterium]
MPDEGSSPDLRRGPRALKAGKYAEKELRLDIERFFRYPASYATKDFVHWNEKQCLEAGANRTLAAIVRGEVLQLQKMVSDRRDLLLVSRS